MDLVAETGSPGRLNLVSDFFYLMAPCALLELECTSPVMAGAA